MSFWVVFTLGTLASFLLGAIPFGLLVGFAHDTDVRTMGSGNVGAMNVGRILGRKWFFVVFILDMLKGLVPALLGGWMLLAYGVQVSIQVIMIARLLLGLAAILGHNYSPFLHFRGGKGVSTSLGVALGVFPDLTVPAVLAFLVWAAGFALSRMSSVGSILGGLCFPLFYLGYLNYRGGSVSEHWPFVAFAMLVALLVVLRHKANIARIFAGTETRVARPGKATGPKELEN